MKILLAVDDSKWSAAAIQAVIKQFKPSGTQVRVMHAVEWPIDLPPYLAYVEGPTAPPHLLALHNTAVEDGKAFVERVAQQLATSGFTTSHLVREGDPRHTILDCAGEWHPDLIVMGSHGRKGVERFVLGSVAEAVMRHATCSVQIVRRPANEPES